ncbi:hypothetical protein [Mucilaginibacter pedocola]|uniref:DUF4747 domain-containing protein n=1 Tax=Mucilaginibacter pedocola TaxID=1792845 RepID=A0A1S9PDT3_9SPHI|nr:hypothetical protein [Mucilaginibacter pedocola]OOQ59120.1 hypothetical protein BC343_29295 [Mucilaginibacter pedocola]
MPNTKTRKISFNTIIKRQWSTRVETPFFAIADVIKYVLSLNKKGKQFEMKEDKFCLLQTAKAERDVDTVLISGFFKSARHTFRPNLIDRQTGEERPSPKRLSEGDIEKTHFAFKITKSEVFLVVEINGNGISANQIVEYFGAFTKKYLTSKGEPKNFTIVFFKIGREDFLEEIKSMKTIRLAKVFFDKKLLGSNCLAFSNRTSNLQRDIELTVKAESRSDITETAIDFYNSFTNKTEKSISKVRIEGKDRNGTEVALDTSFMEKLDSVDVSINATTGEVETTEMLSSLKAFTKDLK